jgi:RNA-directed DNA polymerase
MVETSGSGSVSTKLQRIAELARKTPKMVLTTLAHHIDAEFLREAYRRTRKDGAVGVNGQTAAQYEVNLEENLQALLERFKSGAYYAPPVRRVHIPKGDGRKTRPIGIPTFEDKVLQRAVAMVLEAIYEQDFLDCSYGFRPGRSPHKAMQALWDGLMRMGGGWVLEVDIRSFFDSVDHRHLRSFLDQRVRDGVVRRAVDKWLAAGVLEEGAVWRPDVGTPQGGVISPLLANIYLHEVLDLWFEHQVRPRLHGDARLIRYADDFVIAFTHEADARRVWEVLPKRFGKHGLQLHPEKTRLIDFRRPPRCGRRKEAAEHEARSFDLLGFTVHWGRSVRGGWVVRKKTSSSRFTRGLRAIACWCKLHRHWPVRKQHAMLTQKLRGHYAYYGVTGNMRALGRFLQAVRRVWQKWLKRRSQHHPMTWERFARLEKRYPLPPARVVHSVYRARSEAAV